MEAGRRRKVLADGLMNGDSTVGFNRRILRSDDESGHNPTIIEIKADGVTFHSPSGNSDTVYTKMGDVTPPFMKQGGGASLQGAGRKGETHCGPQMGSPLCGKRTRQGFDSPS